MRWVKRYEIESTSEAGKIYNVSLSDTKEWGCSCPAWTMSLYCPSCGDRVRKTVKKQVQLNHYCGGKEIPIASLDLKRKDCHHIAFMRTPATKVNGSVLSGVELSKAELDWMYDLVNQYGTSNLNGMRSHCLAWLKGQLGSAPVETRQPEQLDFRIKRMITLED